MTELDLMPLILNGSDGGDCLASCQCDDCNLARRTEDGVSLHFSAHDVIDAYAIGHRTGEHRGFDRAIATLETLRRSSP